MPAWPGRWAPLLAGALEALYEAWMAVQPGAEPGVVARLLASGGPDRVVIRYARPEPRPDIERFSWPPRNPAPPASPC